MYSPWPNSPSSTGEPRDTFFVGTDPIPLNRSNLVPHGKITAEVFEVPNDPEAATGDVKVEGCYNCLANCLAYKMATDKDFALLIMRAVEMANLVVLADK